MRYEFVYCGSKKFWEPSVQGKVLVIHYGRIGTEGRIEKKKFPSVTAALVELEKRTREKLRKGYHLTSPNQTKNQDLGSAVIGSIYVGEHTLEAAQDFCRWLTKCLKNQVSAKEFSKLWRGIVERFEELVPESHRPGEPGMTKDGAYWLDFLAEDVDGIEKLYRKAVSRKADRFITFDNNAYVDIVALRGNPGARAIEVCVLKVKNCKCGGCGKWHTDWPAKAGSGAKIQSMSCDYVVLANGTIIEGRGHIC